MLPENVAEDGKPSSSKKKVKIEGDGEEESEVAGIMKLLKQRDEEKEKEIESARIARTKDREFQLEQRGLDRAENHENLRMILDSVVKIIKKENVVSAVA